MRDDLEDAAALAVRQEMDLSCILPANEEAAPRIVIGSLDLTVGECWDIASISCKKPAFWWLESQYIVQKTCAQVWDCLRSHIKPVPVLIAWSKFAHGVPKNFECKSATCIILCW